MDCQKIDYHVPRQISPFVYKQSLLEFFVKSEDIASGLSREWNGALINYNSITHQIILLALDLDLKAFVEGTPIAKPFLK